MQPVRLRSAHEEECVEVRGRERETERQRDRETEREMVRVMLHSSEK